jgi:hypothetical protein
MEVVHFVTLYSCTLAFPTLSCRQLSLSYSLKSSMPSTRGVWSSQILRGGGDVEEGGISSSFQGENRKSGLQSELTKEKKGLQGAVKRQRATDDEQKVSPENKAKRTIKLKTSKTNAENGELISFGNFLDSQLPPMDDLSPVLSTRSRGRSRKIPQSVQNWPNFDEDLSHHRQNIPAHLLDSGPLKMLRRPVTNGQVFVVKRKADICAVLSSTICDALNQLFLKELVTSSFSVSGLAAKDSLGALGKPDFVTVTRSTFRLAQEEHAQSCDAAADAGVSQLTRKPKPGKQRQAVTVFDVRRSNLIKYGRDLVSLYNEENQMIRDAVFQITGYHVAHKCKYGFISSYKYTWATYLDDNGVLYISPCFVSDSIETFSTLNMMYYVTCKSFNELKSKPQIWTPPCFLMNPGPTIQKKIIKKLHCTESKTGRGHHS